MKKYFVLMMFCWPFLSVNVYSQNLLTPEKLWELGRVSDAQVSPDGEQVIYGVTNYDVKQNSGKRDLYILPAAGDKPAVCLTNDLEKSISNARWRPDGDKIGFLLNTDDTMQLWEMNPDGTDKKQVSSYRQSVSNFDYAPDGRHISFTMSVKMDSTIHDLYPDLPDANARLIDDLMYRHWDSWSDYTNSHVFFAPYEKGKITGEAKDIMAGEHFDTPLKPFGGSEDITWSTDGQSIVYVCKKLSGKAYAVSTNSDLYQYDLETSKTVNLTEGMNGYDTNPVFSPDGQTLAWLSMARAGFESDKNNIWLMDLKSGTKKSVSQSIDMSASNLTWQDNSKSIYFIGGVEATYQIFNLPVKGYLNSGDSELAKKLKMVTSGPHNYYSLALANNVLLGAKASISHPIELYTISGKGVETPLTHVNDKTLGQIEMGKVEKRMVKTSDGKDMLVWVIYPPDFDASKKYPTLLYCQGGPQAAVSQFFSYRWNFQLMAANGYIVVAPNRRGLPTFGQEWNDEISKDWGGQAMKDYLAAIDDVSKEPYVDEDRLGAVGASYGGYSIYYLAGIHEGRFKTFISHCGLFNLESWYGSTEELFFANWDIGGPYWEDPKPKSYEQFSPHKFVQNWDTPILVIHGGKDFRVPINQGMEAFQVAQLKGIPSKFLYFPEEGHWVLQPQNGLLWHRVFFEWLDQYLK